MISKSLVQFQIYSPCLTVSHNANTRGLQPSAFAFHHSTLENSKNPSLKQLEHGVSHSSQFPWPIRHGQKKSSSSSQNDAKITSKLRIWQGMLLLLQPCGLENALNKVIGRVSCCTSHFWRILMKTTKVCLIKKNTKRQALILQDASNIGKKLQVLFHRQVALDAIRVSWARYPRLEDTKKKHEILPRIH